MENTRKNTFSISGLDSDLGLQTLASGASQFRERLIIEYRRVAKSENAEAALKQVKKLFQNLHIGSDLAYCYGHKIPEGQSFVYQNWADVKYNFIINAFASYAEVKKWASDRSDYVTKSINEMTQLFGRAKKVDGVEVLDHVDGNIKFIYDNLKMYCEAQQVFSDAVMSKKLDDHGRELFMIQQLARMSDYRWWRRKASKVLAKKREHFFIKTRQVHADNNIYCSTYSVKTIRSRDKRNRKMLEKIIKVNQDGQEFTLAELADKGLANPINRCAEFVVRFKGLDKQRKKYGYVGYFLTFTSPSEFHQMIKNERRLFGKGCLVNKSYNDENTPETAHKRLCKIWANIRTALDNEKIKIKGVRVAEPNHDGTTHWHVTVLFNKCDHLQGLEIIKKIATAHILTDDQQDLDSAFLSKKIDHRGITSYLLKYVLKNLGGTFATKEEEAKCNFLDHEATDQQNFLVTNIERVKAWAAVWSVRQFQTFGDAPVSLWRELRRIKKIDLAVLPMEHRKVIAKLWSSVKKNCWHKYAELLGYTLENKELTDDQQILRSIKSWIIESTDINEYYEKTSIKKGILLPARDNKTGVVNFIPLLTRHFLWRTVKRITTMPDDFLIDEAGLVYSSGGSLAFW